MDGGHYGKTAACDQFHAELNAFLEGESKPFVTAHARECLFCGPVLADLEQIRVAAQALPLEEPSAAVSARNLPGMDSSASRGVNGDGSNACICGRIRLRWARWPAWWHWVFF
jgi:hypothetical protein